MNRIFWLSFGAMVVASLGAGCYAVFTPKIGHATRAQIDAAVPTSLKVLDPPDPEGEARYARLVAAVGRLDDRDVEAAQGSSSLRPGASGYKSPDSAALARVLARGRPMADEVERLLAEGGLRPPQRWPDTQFPQELRFRTFARMLALASTDAASRGDHASCLRHVVLGLRFGKALEEGGGVLIDGLNAAACEGYALRGVYEAEMKGGFDAAGRKAILALLPVRTGPLPAMAGWIRRDFQEMTLPYLIKPERLTKLFESEDDEGNVRSALAGTLDPVASARLLGRIHEAAIADAARPSYAQSSEAMRIADEAAKWLPNVYGTNGVSGLWDRALMNLGANTLGRTLAASGTAYTRLAALGARRAADAHLARAVILLRMGRPADLPDPFRRGNLQIDRKRRLVWSVGEDGVDNRGNLGPGGSTNRDQGYKY